VTVTGGFEIPKPLRLFTLPSFILVVFDRGQQILEKIRSAERMRSI